MGLKAVLLGVGALSTIAAWPAFADDLTFVSKPQLHEQLLQFVYRTSAPHPGVAALHIEWTDADGHLVERRQLIRRVAGAPGIPIELDPRHALALDNTLHVALELHDGTSRDAPVLHEGGATVEFTVPGLANNWQNYNVIMWQSHDLAADKSLRHLGVDAGAVIANRDDAAGNPISPALAPLLQSGVGCYVENIATDFYSAYHRWTPDHPVNWRFTEAQRQYWANPQDFRPLVRDPSLSDPSWQERISDRLKRVVAAYAPYRPLYYSLGDETGIADLAAFWDFDLSPASLTGMRAWLRRRYRSIAALDGQWGSQFSSWDEVVPMTTHEAMQRTDGNFSGWADFKDWMDEAFAASLRVGTDAVHAADATALSAIEGGQPPGWGGYDYARLASAIDVMELYDVADNVDIARSFNPNLIFLTTSSGTGPLEIHRLWRSLLRGGRGAILWDDQDQVVQHDGSPGARGLVMAPVFKELRGGVGALLIDSKPVTDDVAILYSPESQRTWWLLDRRPQGDAWSHRDAGAEYDDNAVRSSTNGFERLFNHLGLNPHFISAKMIEQDALAKYRVLVLPQTIALSQAAAVAVRRFVQAGHMVIADGEAGRYDEHSRVAATPVLSDLLGGPPVATIQPKRFGTGTVVYFNSWKQETTAGAIDMFAPHNFPQWLTLLRSAGVVPMARLTTPGGTTVSNVEMHFYYAEGATIVALQRDIDAGSSLPTEPVTLALPRTAYVYDLRQGQFLRRGRDVPVELGGAAPTILTLDSRTRSPPRMSLPRSIHAGNIATLRVAVAGPPGAMVHVEILDGEGAVLPAYSANHAVGRHGTSIALPVAAGEMTGSWTIKATDVASGQASMAPLTVVGASQLH